MDWVSVLFWDGSAIFCLLVGIRTLIIEFHRFYWVHTWPAVRGTITYSEGTENRDGDGETYLLTARYAYRVNNYRYFGREDVDSLSTERAVAKRAEYYLHSAEIAVAYNPFKPQQSFLADSRRQRLLLWTVVYGIFTLVFGIVMAIGALNSIGVLKISPR